MSRDGDTLLQPFICRIEEPRIAVALRTHHHEHVRQFASSLVLDTAVDLTQDQRPIQRARHDFNRSWNQRCDLIQPQQM